MKAQELRIGNYIKTDDDIICIVSRIETKDYTHWNSGECFSITALELNTKDDYLNVKNDKWQPIELTEEILLKCGFVSNKVTYKLENDKFILELYYYDCWNLTYIEKNKFGNGSVDLQGYWNLHQLQNLYFYLTGEELNIEL